MDAGGPSAANVGHDVRTLNAVDDFACNCYLAGFIIATYWLFASTYVDGHGLCVPCRIACLVLLRIVFELFTNIGGSTYEQYRTFALGYYIYYIGAYSCGEGLNIRRLRSEGTGGTGDFIRDDFMLTLGMGWQQEQRCWNQL